MAVRDPARVNDLITTKGPGTQVSGVATTVPIDPRLGIPISKEGYPRDQYKSESGINTGARGVGNAELRTSAAITGTDLSCNSSRRSVYPHAQITQSPGGHIIEMNDTPGSERIMIRHISGSGIEFRPDGTILISAKGIVFDIDGNMDMVVSGNAQHKVEGAWKQEVGGDIRVNGAAGHYKYAGDLIEQTVGNRYLSTDASFMTRVKKDYSTTVVGATTLIALDGYQVATKGLTKIIGDGDIGIYSSANLNMTAQTRSYLSSPSVAITADQLEVVGNKGTVGGENIIMYNYNMYTGHSIYAEDTIRTETVYAEKSVETHTVRGTVMNAIRYNGDLNGTATLSIAAGTTVASASTVAAQAEDDGATWKPDEAVITERHTNRINGIKKVQVDPGDYIRASIDRSRDNGGGSFNNSSSGKTVTA